MSDLSNHGSDDEGSRRNDWEAVSLSLSSHSLSASMTSCTHAQGRGMEVILLPQQLSTGSMASALLSLPGRSQKSELM